MDKKYPIGTKIRFIHHCLDTNKTGTIVGFTTDRQVDVFLPAARKHIIENRYPTLPDGTKFTWHCGWDEIELLALPNQQLLFDFMNDG